MSTTLHRRAPRLLDAAFAFGGTLAAIGTFGQAALAKPPAKAPAAVAGPKDKAVLKLDEQALGKDYLEANFIKAERKLQQALRTCGTNGCSPGVLAQLHRDLAVIYIAGLGKTEAGKKELKTGIELNPDLQLDPDYATPDLKKIWLQLRGGKAKLDEPKRKAAAAGVTHSPVKEQAVATPVPLFVQYSGADGAKLRVWYKAVGAERWTSGDMEAGASGFSYEIPCTATGKPGDLAYFIEVFGENDETLDKDGSRTEPHVVAIVKELAGEAPHLPDASPPDVCKNVCDGDDCPSDGPKPKRARNNWFSLSVQQDLAIIGAATGVCTGEIQVYGAYSCFRASGSQYLGFPVNDPGDNVNGGLSLSTTRLLVGYDRVLVAGLVLGVRVGAVLQGLGPRADGASANAPLLFHGELRLGYWFGSDVFSTNGFRPYLFAAGGLAQVDTKFNVIVHEDPTIPPSPSQTNNPPAQALSAYRRMGQAFVGGGLGAMYAFTPAFGLFLDAKFMHLLPTSGDTLSPELGLAVGF